MTPSRSVRRGRSPSAAISTGTMAPLSTADFGNSCRRHRNSWLLFTSWRRAMIDTETPGACVSATIWRFSASEYCRRSGRLVSTTPLVDTCSACSAIRRSLRQSACSGRRCSPSAYGDRADYVGTGGLSRFPKDPRQVGHNPRRAIDAIVGGRLVQKAKHSLLDSLVVELAGGFSLTREQRSMPAILERPEVLAIGLHIDPKKVAHCAAVQATAACKNHHGSVAIGQAAVVKAVEQRRDVADITDLLAKRLWANLLLKDGAHPLERGLTGLLAPVGFRGDTDYPTGITEELLYASARNDRWIGTG